MLIPLKLKKNARKYSRNVYLELMQELYVKPINFLSMRKSVPVPCFTSQNAMPVFFEGYSRFAFSYFFFLVQKVPDQMTTFK